MNPIEWADTARDQLADIWVAATPNERDQIERIIMRLERGLADDPLSVGESRSGPLRVEVISPLVIWFNVIGNFVRIIRVTRPQRSTP
jgi:plasmid stabilization system protein ParE